MPSREPMWYCYECNAEMRPIMAPDAHCASCNGTFVEKMDDPDDDPRNFAHGDGNEGPELGDMPNLGPMLFGLSQMLANANPHTTGPRSTRQPVPPGAGTPRNAYSDFRFEMTSGSGSNTQTFVLGGPNTLGRSNGPQRPTLNGIPGFMRRSSGPAFPPTPGEISGPAMAQYLMALLGGHARGQGDEDPFGAMFGPENGRMGDFVFSEQALDQIISDIMENSNAHRPVPATDEVTDKLPKEVLEEGSALLEKDCAVCKEQFSLQTEEPDELIVVTLPCKHPFHQSCILPWLKQSGTCPVCRYALVSQPDHGPAPATGSPSPSMGPHNNNSESQSPSLNDQGNQGGGVLNSLLSYIRGSQSNNPNDGTSHPTGSSVPGGWTEQAD